MEAPKRKPEDEAILTAKVHKDVKAQVFTRAIARHITPSEAAEEMLVGFLNYERNAPPAAGNGSTG